MHFRPNSRKNAVSAGSILMKAVLLAAFLFVPVAHAQQSWNPSYDELIRGLSPKAAGATRGIRPVTPLHRARPEPLAPPAASRQVAVHFAPPYHAPPPPQSRQSNDLASVQLQIPFETGSDRLTPACCEIPRTPSGARCPVRNSDHTGFVSRAIPMPPVTPP